MNILETFFVLFKTDADEAERDMASAEAQADKLADAMGKVGAVDAAPAKALSDALADAGTKAQALDAQIQDLERRRVENRTGLGGVKDVDLAASLRASLTALEAEKAALNRAKVEAEGLADALSNADAAAKRAGDAAAKQAREVGEAATRAGQQSVQAQGRVREALEGTGAKAQSIAQQIQAHAVELVEAERNINRYLLGQEDIRERTLQLLGGQEGLTKRIEAETKAVAAALLNAERGADRLGDELAEADRHGRGLGRSFMGMAQRLLGPIAAVVSLGAAIGGVRSHIDATLELVERASRARIDVSGYDAWRRAIRDAGGSAEKAESQFEAFADKVTEAFGDAESEAGKALKAMGVSAKDAGGNIKSTDAALLDLADAMSKVSKQTAVDSLRRLGIVDPVMVDLILQGREGLERMLETQRKNGALTVQQAQAYREFRGAVQGLQDTFRALIDRLLGSVLPTATRVFDAFKAGIQWLADHRDLVAGFGIALAAALTVAAGVALAVYAPAMYAAAAATLAATWPILAIIAAVAALAVAFALAYEDVKAFLSGQPSLLGDLAERYGWVREAVDAIRDGLTRLALGARIAWAALTEAGRVVTPVLARIASAILGGLLRATRMIATVWRGVWQVVGPILSVIGEAIWTVAVITFRVSRAVGAAWRALFSALLPVAKPALDAVGGAVRIFGAVFSGVAQAVRDAWSRFFSWFVDRVRWAADLAKGLLQGARAASEMLPGGPPRQTAAAIRQGRTQITNANRAPTNRVTSAAVANSRPANRTTSVRVDRVEVQTQATDAQGISRDIGTALGSEMRRAAQDADDGVDR